MPQVDVYLGGNSGEQECYKLMSIWVELRRTGILQVDVYLGGSSGEQECYMLMSIWVGAKENRNTSS